MRGRSRLIGIEKLTGVFFLGNLLTPQERNVPSLIKRKRHHKFNPRLQKDLKRLKWRRKHNLT